MTVPQNQFWHIRSGVTQQLLLDKLAEKFRIETEEPVTNSVSILDDPDSAVWASGNLLVKASKNSWWLYHENGIDKVSRVSAKSRFWWDLPESTLRNRLKALVDLRAVLEVDHIDIVEQVFLIRNDDEKIVVRGNLTIKTLLINTQGPACLWSLNHCVVTTRILSRQLAYLKSFRLSR